MNTSIATTRGIRVEATPQFNEQESKPTASLFVYSYKIKIKNEGKDTVQLVSRHWIITDGLGRVENVKGPGVIGKQPILKPGESFEYSSFCPLSTPVGSMKGTFQMLGSDKVPFDVEIAEFALKEKMYVN